MKLDSVELELYKHTVTSMAILVSKTEHEGEKVWLPLSHIEIEYKEPYGKIMIVTMPEWMALKKGLI